MHLLMFLVIGFFLFVFGLINFYVGLRIWQYLGQYLSLFNRTGFWLVFSIVALSYLIARLGSAYLPMQIRYVITVIGAYWLAALFYAILLFAAVDLVKFLDKKTHFLPAAWSFSRHEPVVGIVVVCLVALLLVGGTLNARTPRVVHYDITIPKKAGPLQQLHAVMVSDIHLGEIMHNGRLTKLVEMVDSLNPDLILLPGDVLDEDVGPFVQQDMSATFRRLNPKYGIYAVPGNHEHIGRDVDTPVFYLEQAGIKVLRDETVQVAGSFYLAGRDDKSHTHFSAERNSKSLKQILEGVDHTLPLILLQHQPTELGEAATEGIDLQLSGHTHRGQLFPLGFITRAIFEIDWGYLRKGNLQVIVSAGYGTWGPPIRTGNRPEVVDIFINFASS